MTNSTQKAPGTRHPNSEHPNLEAPAPETPAPATPNPLDADGPDRSAADFNPVMWFPPAEKHFVQTCYKMADSILEYGSGGSTVFAARETRARVVSVESDRKWAADLAAHLITEGIDRPDVVVRWCDIGRTRGWGQPAEAGRWGQFHTYPLLPWSIAGFSPELVLIDGRFRMACLAAVMLHCQRPTTVLFDDYARRPAYHAVERVVPLKSLVGRMARFEIEPKNYDRASYAAMLPWFFSTE